MAKKIDKYGKSPSKNGLQNISPYDIEDAQLWMLMVCPHCATEQYAQLVDKKFEDESSHNYTLAKEMEAIIQPENFKCMCCDEPLSFDVGFFFSSCSRFYRYEMLKNARNGRNHARSLPIVPPEAFYRQDRVLHDSKNTAFGDRVIKSCDFKYPNEAAVRSYASANGKNNQVSNPSATDEHLYEDNPISLTFCEKINAPKTFSAGSQDFSIDRCFRVRYSIGDSEGEFRHKNSTMFALTLDEMFQMMREYREVLSEPDRNNRVQELIRQKSDLSTNLGKINGSVLSPTELKEYLIKIITIETDIRAIIQRLPKLYFIKSEYDRYKNQKMTFTAERNAIATAQHILNGAFAKLDEVSTLEKMDPLAYYRRWC